jgi:hypothetical protein
MSENQLHLETSPYLLQHRDNPVHWMAWGEAAFARARRDNKPVLLSIGYAACHWCHVMAHESFEDDETAQLMNELFVNIKVDREERPDIDRIYMAALHETGEQGGWPLTMFLTPDAEPFWGGTYFPKQAQYGRPSFKHILNELSRIYHEEPDKVAHNSQALKEALNAERRYETDAELSMPLLDEISRRILQLIDMTHGGLQGAPKFPQTGLFELLWRAALRRGDAASRQAVITTLTHICQGGIYDHLGGGFARYSVDQYWLAPHFEKMLYDNAQLLSLMTHVWQETRDPLLHTRIAETAEWVLREMIADSGAFAASLDADSEGVEGKFYVWAKSEIEALLEPDDAALFCRVYDISEHGNWEETNIPNRLHSLELLDAETEARLAASRTILLRHRTARIPPGWDDKVLTDWNGLMIAGLAQAAAVFDAPAWHAAAARAFAVIADTMYVDGHLRHSLRLGDVRHFATADGYANMIAAALALYQTTGEAAYLDHARTWAEDLERHYLDPARGGYFFTSAVGETLITRSRSAADDAVPNANGTMLSNLARLHVLTGEPVYAARADALVAAFTGEVLANAYAHTTLLNGFEDLVATVQCIVIGERGDASTQSLITAVRRQPIPALALSVLADTSGLPAGHPAAGKTRTDGMPTLYVCKGTRCSLPITDPDDDASIRAAV